MTDAELRALDARVYREVFGRECRPLRRSVQLGDGELSDWPYRDAETRSEVPRYSSDAAAAWSVVARIREALYPCHVAVTTYPDGTVNCLIESARPGEVLGKAKWSAGADTAPLAVCRAALKAVGKDHPT